MQDNDIKQRLKGLDVSPSEGAKERAAAAAMQAFAEHQEKKRQGFTETHRPTRNPIMTWGDIIGRLTMRKAYAFAGSLAALTTVLAITTVHYSTIMQPVMPAAPKEKTVPIATDATASQEKAEEMVMASPPPVSSSVAATNAQPLPTVNELQSNLGKVHNTKDEEYNAPALHQRAAKVAAGSISLPYRIEPPTARPEGRDRFEHFQSNPVKQTAQEPVSTFSIDVDTASYSFVRRMLNGGTMPQADMVRVEEMINYFPYDYPVPASKEEPFKPQVTVTPTPWNPDTKLVHIGIKGHEVAKAEKPRSNLVFLIDVSGSMSPQDRLPLVKNALRMLVDQLNPDDTVGIVVYAGSVGTVLEPTKISEKNKIVEALNHLESGGSTAGGEGIRQAYALAKLHYDKNAVNRVILATDGDFNVGITDPQALREYIEKERTSGIFLSILGFGQGNYNDALMQKLAQHGNGNAAYIDNLNEARKVLVEEAGSTLFTIANDVKIQVEFNPALVSEYRLVGYESRILNREDFNNDKVDAGDVGSGHAVTAIYEITPAGGKKQVDDLRYGHSAPAPVEVDKGKFSGEYGFLKIRYKLPGESASKLITQPIGTAQEVKNVAQASDDVRFAEAVAAFGQLLKGDSRMGRYSYDDVAALAESARGKDTFGYRAEFINIVRLTKAMQPVQPQPMPEPMD